MLHASQLKIIKVHLTNGSLAQKKLIKFNALCTVGSLEWLFSSYLTTVIVNRTELGLGFTHTERQ